METFPSEWNQSLYDRMAMFTDVRADHPEWAGLSVRVGRGVLSRFDRTVRSFYKRCKEGENPGFPRFKSYRRWRTIEIPDVSPSMPSLAPCPTLTLAVPKSAFPSFYERSPPPMRQTVL